MFYILSSLLHFGHLMNICTNLSWEWQRQFQIKSSKNYNFNVNEDFVLFLISKLITCFINGSTYGMKSQSIVDLAIGSAHILHFKPWRSFNMGFVVKRPSRMQGQFFFSKLGRGRQHILVGSKKFFEGVPNLDLTPQKFVSGCLTSAHVSYLKITRLIVMGLQPMMHPLASIWGIVFYV